MHYNRTNRWKRPAALLLAFALAALQPAAVRAAETERVPETAEAAAELPAEEPAAETGISRAEEVEEAGSTELPENAAEPAGAAAPVSGESLPEALDAEEEAAAREKFPRRGPRKRRQKNRPFESRRKLRPLRRRSRS